MKEQIDPVFKREIGKLNLKSCLHGTRNGPEIVTQANNPCL